MKLKFPSNKLFGLSIIGLLVIGLIYVVIQLPFFSDLRDSDTLFPHIWGFGLGIFLFTYSAIYAYYAWSLRRTEFAQWELEQSFLVSSQATPNNSNSNYWATRICAPLLAIISLIIITAAVFSLIRILNN